MFRRGGCGWRKRKGLAKRDTQGVDADIKGKGIGGGSSDSSELISFLGEAFAKGEL